MFLYLQPEGNIHKREVYNSLDLFGDLGGVMEVFSVLFGTFITPISSFAFILKATKMLFHARTSDSEMFIEKSNKDLKKVQIFTPRREGEKSKEAQI
jgi:hypothetical protein